MSAQRRRAQGLVSMIGLAVVLACGGAAQAGAVGLERFDYRRLVMGVEARVVLYAGDEEEARAAAGAAFARLQALEDVMSDWRPTSELERLGARAGTGPVRVSEDLLRVLERALALAEASGGAFDPTVGPLTHLRRAGKEPGPEERAAARARVGWQRVRLDPERRTVALAVPGMRLDLGGIGKGFACDEALAVLAARGFPRALVELGGDLVVGDAPPGRAGWRVAAGCDPALRATVLTIVNRGLATSGDTEQALVVAGVRHSHVLDARSGEALRGPHCTSVLAPDGATADALASAASVLGPRAGHALVSGFPRTRLLVEDAALRELFDGETLAGWTTRVGGHDGAATWSVEDGAITGRAGRDGAGGVLATAETFAGFRLELDVWLDRPLDAAVLLRTTPTGAGARITLEHRPGGAIGAIDSGGLVARSERGAELWRDGEWNHLEVRCGGAGMRIEAWLNGRPLVTHEVPSGAPGHARSGRIGLQVRGDRDDPPKNAARFQRIRIRELPAGPAGDERGGPR